MSKVTWIGHPLHVKSYVYFWEPDVVYQAQIMGSSWEFPLTNILTDSGSTLQGSIFDVEEGMTIYIGSSAGTYDLGRVRTRDITPDGTTLPIGRTSRGARFGELNPAAGSYITVVNHFDVWSKTPFIDEDGVITKDEISFRASIAQPPIAHAGEHNCGFVDDGTALLTVNFDAVDTTIIQSGAGAPVYAWDFGAGATPETATTATVSGVTFPAGKPRWIKLTVSHNSVSHTTRRVIYPAARTGADSPTTLVVDSFTRTLKPEGQIMNFRLKSDTVSVPDGAMVIFMQEEDFGGSPGPLIGDSILKFIGYHVEDPAEVSASRQGTVTETTIRAEDFLQRSSKRPGFSQVIQRKTSPKNWNHLKDADIDRYTHYLLHWHSTLSEVTGVKLSGLGSTYPVTTLGSTGSSLYSQLDKMARAITHRLTSNHRGMIQVVQDPMRQDTIDRISTVVVDIDEADWTEVRFIKSYYPKVHWLRSSAIVADTTKVPVVFSQSPGESPGQGLSSQNLGQLLTTGQTHLNIITGHDYARLNAEFGIFDITLAHGGDIGINPAEMTWIRSTLSASNQTERGISYTDERFLPLEITYSTDTLTGSQRCRIRVEREVEGTPGVTYIPDSFDFPGFNFPELNLGLPDITLPEIDLGDFALESGRGAFAVLTDLGGLYTTTTWNDATPSWAGLDLTEYGFSDTPVDWSASPHSPLYVDKGDEIETLIAGLSHLWLVRDTLGPNLSVEKVFSFDNQSNQRMIGWSRGRANWAIIASWDEISGQFVTSTWSKDLLNWTQSVVTSQTLTGSLNTEAFYPGLWLSPYDAGTAITTAWFNSTDNDVSIAVSYITHDFGQTWNLFNLPDINPDAALAETLQIPFEFSIGHEVAFYGRQYYANPRYDSRLYRAIGSQITDITPVFTAVEHGPYHSGRSFAVSDADFNQIYLIGWDSTGDQHRGVFITANAGSATPSWITPVSPVSAVAWHKVYASASDKDLAFLLGDNGTVAWIPDGTNDLVKTGDMTHGDSLVGIIAGDGYNPPLTLPSPSMRSVSSVAVLVDGNNRISYSEDFEASNPSWTELTGSFSGNPTDVDFDYSSTYVTNDDGTGQLDLWMVTRDTVTVRCYNVTDVLGTPGFTLEWTSTLLDSGSAIDPRIHSNNITSNDVVTITFGDQNEIRHAYSDDGGTTWQNNSNIVVIDPTGDFSSGDIACASRDDDIFIHSNKAPVITGDGSIPLDVRNGQVPFFDIRIQTASSERTEFYSPLPYTAARLLGGSAILLARPEISSASTPNLFFDYDTNLNYDIIDGSLSTGLSGNGIKDNEGSSSDIEVWHWWSYPVSLTRQQINWFFNIGPLDDPANMSLQSQLYLLNNSLGIDFYQGSASFDDGVPPDNEWQTKILTEDYGPANLNRINSSGGGSGDVDIFIDNLTHTIESGIDTLTNPALFLVSSYLSSPGSATWLNVTPGGETGFVPFKTHGISVSQDNDEDHLAIIGKDLSDTYALSISSTRGLSWSLIGLADDTIHALTHNQNKICVWGESKLGVSDNGGATFFDKVGSYAADVGALGTVKRAIVRL